MAEEKNLRVLEGLGYCAAVLIGVSALGTSEALKLFHVAGLIIALVVVVRLLSLSIVTKGAESKASAANLEVAPEEEEQEEAREEVTR